MTLGRVRRLLLAAVGRGRAEASPAPQVPDGLAATAARLGDLYPRWLVLGNDRYGLWAASREEHAPPIGCTTYLAAETEADLERQLREQEISRNRRPPA